MKIYIAVKECQDLTQGLQTITDASFKHVLFEIKRRASDAARKITKLRIDHINGLITVFFLNGSEESWRFKQQDVFLRRENVKIFK